jgi:LysR family transcriptional regulator of gallate degradation
LLVSEAQHLTRASRSLARSQSAVTRSIGGLEEFLGERLFERTATGMALTRHGEILLRRVRAAVDHMAPIEAEIARRARTRRPGAKSYSLFDLGNATIFTFLAVCDQRDYRSAARQLGVTASPVRKLLVKLEQQIGTRLFEREPRGVVRLNDLGTQFAICTKRALWEIRAGLEELRSQNGEVSGQVRVGVMSTARSFLVPRAVDQLRRLHPKVLTFLYWGNYHDMKAALHCGDIDFIVGTLRADEVDLPENETVVLMRDRVRIVARTEHPLAQASDVSLKDLLACDWILPPQYFPLRMWFEDLLKNERLKTPQPFLETGSLATLRGTLLESDCVTVSTDLQCWHDTTEHGLLRALPAPAVTRACIDQPFHLHLTRRAEAMLSPPALALYAAVQAIARSVEREMFGDTEQDVAAASLQPALSAVPVDGGFCMEG